MAILTKTLALIFSAAPVIVLAMDTDNTSGQKRPHSLISTIEKAENQSNSSKRQKTEEQDPLDSSDPLGTETPKKGRAQKIIELLDQTVPGQPNQAVYSASRKYQQIDQIRQSIELLNGLEPETRKLLLGDHAENRLKEMETTYTQLIKRYTRDFFGRVRAKDFDPKKDLSSEIVHRILSYCSAQDWKNIAQVSHEATHAVHSLPILQHYFNSAVKYGRYQSISEFRDDFLSGSPRAYAAAGIVSYFRKQEKLRKLFNEPQVNKAVLFFQRLSYVIDIHYNKRNNWWEIRNNWLDIAFNAYNPLAVAFVFHNKLFTSSKGIRDTGLLDIIGQTYNILGANRGHILDAVILKYLRSELAQCSEERQILSIVRILQTVMSQSLGANIMLCDIYSNGVTAGNSGQTVQVIAPDKNKSEKYFETAMDIANMLPNDLKGQAHTELGLWRLIQLSRAQNPTDQEKKNFFQLTDVHWRQAIDAWTKAAGGDRKKAVTRFKSFLYDNRFFSGYEDNKPIIYLSAPTDIIFLDTTKSQHTVALAYLAMPYEFLRKLYDSDKKDNDQPYFYHKDAKLMLRIATTIWDALVLKHGPQLSPDLEQSLKNELSITVYCFWGAIIESLRGRDVHLQQEIAKEIAKFCRSTEPLIIKIQKYERIAKKLGLIPNQ